MRNLKQLLQMTENILNREKEVSYEEVETLIQKRDEVIVQLKDQWDQFGTNEQHQIKKMIADVLSYDGKIVDIMQNLKSEASSQLQNIRAQKIQHSGYIKNMSQGINFFDKQL